MCVVWNIDHMIDEIAIEKRTGIEPNAVEPWVELILIIFENT